MKLLNRIWLSSLFLLVMISINTLQAQVTIGADEAPENFIALKLVSTSAGVRYPQLTEAQVTTLNTSLTGKTTAYGLMEFVTSGQGGIRYYTNTNTWVDMGTPTKSTKTKTLSFDDSMPVNINDIVANNNIKEYAVKNVNTEAVDIVGVGKYLDSQNIIKDVRIDTSSVSSTKIKVEFYPKIKEFLQKDKEGYISSRLYVTYLEGGVQKQEEFTIKIDCKDDSVE